MDAVRSQHIALSRVGRLADDDTALDVRVDLVNEIKVVFPFEFFAVDDGLVAAADKVRDGDTLVDNEYIAQKIVPEKDGNDQNGGHHAEKAGEHADAVGAAAGLCCAASKLGKQPQVVIDLNHNAAGEILKKLRARPENAGVFIGGSEALLRMQPGALLIVVDTNRPDFVESPSLLGSCNRLAVIDHHRRAASYIENAALNFHEPYASSASELVSELLQYLIDPGDLLRAEAEALFAGIVLDTKNFTMRTGGRTFEAAALLRRVGVDRADVQRLFQGTLSDMIERYDIIRHAELYHNDIAIAAVEQDIDRVTAAKAADELLTLRGVRASFVLFKHDTGVNLSARSLGEINVQLIMEKLGGGGNSTTAGGQIPDGTVDAVREQLIAAIDQYLEG